MAEGISTKYVEVHLTTDCYLKIIYMHIFPVCIHPTPSDQVTPKDPGWHDDSALPPHLHARLLILVSNATQSFGGNFLVIRLGLHTEIVAAASDFTCAWELMFKMGSCLWGLPVTKHWVTC